MKYRRYLRRFRWLHRVFVIYLSAIRDIAETGNHDCLIDERLTSSGFARLDSFRDRRWLVGDVVRLSKRFLSRAQHPIRPHFHPHLLFPRSPLLVSSTGDLSRSRSTFRVRDCFVISINYPRLTGEYGRTDGDNNDNDKRVNNTATYSGTRSRTILMMDTGVTVATNPRRGLAFDCEFGTRSAHPVHKSPSGINWHVPDKREFCASPIIYLRSVEISASACFVSACIYL